MTDKIEKYLAYKSKKDQKFSKTDKLNFIKIMRVYKLLGNKKASKIIAAENSFAVDYLLNNIPMKIRVAGAKIIYYFFDNGEYKIWDDRTDTVTNYFKFSMRQYNSTIGQAVQNLLDNNDFGYLIDNLIKKDI